MTLTDRLRDAWRQIRWEVSRKGILGDSADPVIQGLSSIISNRGTPPMRHVEDLLVAYSRAPWLRAVVGKIGFTTASTPWQLFAETPGGPEAPPVTNSALKRAGYPYRKRQMAQKQFDNSLVQIENHPALELLDWFNPLMTGLGALKLTQNHIDLVGEAFWIKQRDPLGKPVGLWPMPPPWVRSTPRADSPFYVIQHNALTIQVPITEMVWFLDIDPARPYWRGKGTGESLGDELEADEYAAKHTKTEFYNRGVPELLVTAEGLGDDETRRLEADWKQRNRGLFKALQVYFLNRKVDVKQLGQSFKSLQLIQLRQFERDMVIQVFGVPPEILGIIEKSNRSTIEAADFLFSRWVLIPRLELQRTTIQEALITPDYDERLILDYQSPVDEDFERKMQAAKAAPHTMRVNEWRELQGQDPIPPEEGGDVFWVPQNLVPIRTPAEAAPAPSPRPGVPQVPPPAPSQPEPSQGARAGLKLVYDKDALDSLESMLDKVGDQ